MQDDLLDMTPTEAVLGKPVGNDLRERKMTVPVILALDGADREFRADVERFYGQDETTHERIAAMIAGIAERGGFEKTKVAVSEYIDGPKRRSRRSETRRLAPSSPPSRTPCSPSRSPLMFVTHGNRRSWSAPPSCIFGADKLPKLARSAGQAKKEFMVGQAEADLAAEKAREEARKRAATKSVQAAEAPAAPPTATGRNGVGGAATVPDPITGAPGPTTIAPPHN